MPSDLDTLLRDAGRGPTTQIDAESIHARGRRRARGRRVATGAGALTVVAVVAVGAAAVLDTGRGVDVAPVDELPAVGGDGARAVDVATVAEEFGVVVRSIDIVEAGVVAVRDVGPASDVTATVTNWPDRATWVTTDDGALWVTGGRDTALRRVDPTDLAAGGEVVARPLDAVAGATGLLPIGTATDGVSVVATPDPSIGDASEHAALVVVAPDGSTSMLADPDEVAPVRAAAAPGGRITAVSGTLPRSGDGSWFVRAWTEEDQVGAGLDLLPAGPEPRTVAGVIDGDAAVTTSPRSVAVDADWRTSITLTDTTGDEAPVTVDLPNRELLPGAATPEVIGIAALGERGPRDAGVVVGAVAVTGAGGDLTAREALDQQARGGIVVVPVDALRRAGDGAVLDASALVVVEGVPRPSVRPAPTTAPAVDTDTIDEALAAETGMVVTRVVRQADGSAHVLTTRPDDDQRVVAVAVDRIVGSPVVAADRSVWFLDDAGEMRRTTADGSVKTIIGAANPTAWMPVAADGIDVAAIQVPFGDREPDDIGLVMLFRASQDVPGAAEMIGVPGVFVLPSDLGDWSVVDADVGPELVVTVQNDGESWRAVAHVAGRPPQDATTLLETDGAGRWISDVTMIAGRAHVLEVVDDGRATVLHVLSPRAGSAVGQVELPGEVVGITGTLDSDLVVLDVADDTGVHSRWLLDRDELLQRGVSGEAELDRRGIVRLTPSGTVDDPPQQAPCAADEQLLNAPPDGEFAIWWLCHSATPLLADGDVFPYWRDDSRWTGADLADDPGAIAAVLGTWADGPTDLQAALGLSGGLDPEVATFGAVSLDGRTLVVDVLPGPTVGVLGATYANAVFTTSVVGMAAQFDGYGALGFDRVRLTLDGSCEAWAALVEAGPGCVEHDLAPTPWNQADGP